MEIIAHRGRLDKGQIENTKEAFLSNNSKNYIIGSECDVRITHDNKIVVSHYDNLARITGKKRRISKSNYSDISKSNIKADKFDTLLELFHYIKYRNLEGIRNLKKYFKRIGTFITLEELLSIYNKDKLLLIDIKDSENNIENEIYAEEIIKVLDKFPNNKFYLQGYSIKILEYIKEKRPNFVVGILIDKNIDNIDKLDFVNINYRNLTKDMAINILKSKRKLMLWTIDNKRELLQIYKELGELLNKCIIISKHPNMVNRYQKKLVLGGMR